MTAPARILLHATPPPAPLAMPTQALSRGPARLYRWPGWRTAMARLVAFGGAAALAVAGYVEMSLVFGNESSTPLQALLLTLFTITFAWIAFSATQALAAAFVAPRPRDEDDGSPATGRTVLVMPVYNEDPAATAAALYAMCEGLARKPGAFEVFILSDTRDPEVWVQETACHDWLRSEIGPRIPIWYRRRVDNAGRKAGNLREFVERWGARYDYMLVLDADSLMAPETIRQMARRMEADPRLGILQTSPTLIGGDTVFARLQQFASRLYGPIISRGVAAWQGRDGNYWGHNAMIRVRAFADHCGLPDLQGRKPFGGHVLSHDFVEAALIRRGGWDVRMDPDIGGSWEGSPPSLLDLAARDRRWAQGNLQHVKVLSARGLSLASRAHFMIGIGAYLMSPIWLALLLTGALLTGQSLINERDYFPDGLQLFPEWPVFDAERMLRLFWVSMALLLAPKIIGAVRAMLIARLRRGFGGAARIALGAATEIILSALYAPVLMSIQARQIWEILSGRDSGWSAQSREGGGMSWREAFVRHWRQVAAALLVAAPAVWFAPEQAVWFAPVFIGLAAAPALSRLSGSRLIGRRLFMLFTPEDRMPPASARRARAAKAALDEVAGISLIDLARHPTLRARHVATLHDGACDMAGAGMTEPADAARLAVITARAKIEAADDATTSLGWLSPAETAALVGSPSLMSRWSQTARQTAQQTGTQTERQTERQTGQQTGRR
ncbi:MAG: glucans biosynthesis glucosyltransferase MdoH [Pseudomonadota bacterium]